MDDHPTNDVDALLELLAHSRRRHALSCLGRHEELTLADLAEQVAQQETGVAVANLPAERVARVYFSLYHTHVPKLEAAAVVSYHQERDLVTRRDGMEAAVRRAREALADVAPE